MPIQNIILAGDRQRQWAIQKIQEAPQGYIVKIGEPTRSDRQNRLLHPLLQAIINAQPERWPSMEAIKLTFMDALNGELAMLPKLSGQGFFPVGRKTSTLSVTQFNALIELVHQYAAQHQIELPDVKTSGREAA